MPAARMLALEPVLARPGLRYALLVVLCLVCFLPGFFTIPPVDRDEPRYTQATRQMLESGDYVNIRFQDDPRHKKLVGIYWLQAGAVAALDPDRDAGVWPYRIPSLIGATLAVLLTAWGGTRLFGAAAGTFAAVMMAGSLLLGVEARLAKTDAALLAAIVAAQAALARVYLARDDAEIGLGPPLLFWLAAGIGVLIKGPVLPLVCGGTGLWLIVTERRIAWLRRLRFGIGIPLALLIVLPWLVAITVMTEGAFLERSFGHDMFGKISESQESHGAPPGYYLLAFWLTFWPFSLLAGLAIPWVWRHRATPEVRFCLGWIVPTWLLFELSVTKLPHYVLPTYPAIALLTAAAAMQLFGWGEAARMRWRAWWPVLPWGLATVLLPIAVAALPFVLESDVPLLALILALAALLIVLAALGPLRRGDVTGGALRALCGAIVLYVAAYAFVFPNLTGLWLSPRLVEAIAREAPCPEPKVATTGHHEPSFVFLAGTETRLTDPEGAADFLLEGGCRVAVVGERQQPAFLETLRRHGAGVQLLAEIRGTNLNGADRQRLRLYRLEEGGS